MEEIKICWTLFWMSHGSVTQAGAHGSALCGALKYEVLYAVISTRTGCRACSQDGHEARNSFTMPGDMYTRSGDMYTTG